MDKEAPTSKVLRAFWKEKLEDWEASGKSGALWCKEQQLSYHYFTHWKKILFSEKKNPEPKTLPDPKEPSSFTELSDSPSGIEGSGVKIQHENLIIHLDRNFDPKSLGRILLLLRTFAC